MDLVTYPHPALLAKTRPLTPEEAVSEEVRSRIEEMREIMHGSDGVGLAAPQVAWSVRLLLISPEGTPESDRVLINPVIKKRRGKVIGEEGCLSFPGIFVQVERAKEVDVEFLDGEGKLCKETAGDFPARVIQHELDHLENILLLHRMSPADRVRVKRDLESLSRKED